VVTGSRAPRIRVVPESDRSLGPLILEVARRLRVRLDGWQEDVILDASGIKPDGRWAANTVGLCVGRQNGKGEILLVREVAGLFVLDEMLLIHSAHEQATSSEHFRRLLQAIESVPEFDRKVLRVSRGKGAEAIELRSGARVMFKTRTGSGGRGFAEVDFVAADEAMILNAAAASALIPTQAAKSMDGNYQVWYVGSAVDRMNPKHDGVEFARVRAAAIGGADRVTYEEWSADASAYEDDPAKLPAAFLADVENARAANPSLGIRISMDFVDHEREVTLGVREFAVERLGVGDWPDPTESEVVISPEAWDALADDDSEMVDPVCFAFDVSPDRSSAAICAAGKRRDGLGHVEVIRHDRGTGWVVPRLLELHSAGHAAVGFVCDGAGPAASLLPQLEQAGVEVTTVSAKEHGNACGLLFDAVEQQTLRHLGTHELGSAVRGATSRPLGDAWAWSRKNSNADICPLVAATLAFWGSGALSKKPKAAPRVIDLSTV